MLHTGRVGSTVVAQMLAGHPALIWEGEIFERRLEAPGSRRTRFIPPLIDLRLRLGAAVRAGRRYGFETKHHYEHHGHHYGLYVEAYVEHLAKIGVDHFIEVRRENYLRQIVSGVRLRGSGRSHARLGERVEREPLVIDPEAVPLGRVHLPLRARFAEMDDLHARTAEALRGRRALHLTYEQDIEDEPWVAYARICEFLGLDPVPTEPTLRRTNDAALTELIANYEEVASDLAGTPYEWMLEGQRGLPAED